MSRKPALGKGLNALIPQTEEKETWEREKQAIPPSGTWIEEIRIAEIRPNPRQPRRKFDEEALTELADSIRTHGILQPLLVKPAVDGYELVSGERRLRAARMAGLLTVPAIEVNPEDEIGMLTIALVENVQRTDLGPLELARAYNTLSSEFEITQEDIAKVVGKSRPNVANTLRLLELSEEVQEAIDNGEISAGHARALLIAPTEARKLLFERMKQKTMNVRDLETAARASAKRRARATQWVEADAEAARMVEEMSKRVEENLKRKCRIKRMKAGRGRLTLEFYSNRDLEVLVKKLAGN